MSIQERRIKVKFKAEYRADGGFRVYAVEPTGLYVSSANTYAAAEYFMNLIPCVVADPETAKTFPGLSLLTEFDWEKIVADGGGETLFELKTKEEMEALHGAEPDFEDQSRQSGDFPPKAGEEPELAKVGLRVAGRTLGSRKFLVATDPGETNPELERIIALQERVQ